MSITAPENARGPIIDLKAPAFANPVDVVVRNTHTGKSLVLNLPVLAEPLELSLDFYRRTILDGDGNDQSALLSSLDHALWDAKPVLVPGVNTNLEVEAAGGAQALSSNFIAGSAPRGIAVHNGWGGLYWTDEVNVKIRKAKIDGSNVQDLLTAANGVQKPYGLTASPTHLYWTDLTSKAICRARLRQPSGAVDEVDLGFIAGLSNPRGVAVDSRYVYWADSGTGRIGRAALDGSSFTPEFISGVGPLSIAVNDTHIYYAMSGEVGIGRANIDGTGATTLLAKAVTGTYSGPIALDSTYLYWMRATGIGRAVLDGSSPNNAWIAAGSITGGGGMALNGQVLFFGNNEGAVGRTRGAANYALDATIRWEKGYF